MRSSSKKTYAYRAMLEVFLGYNQGGKISHLTMGLYSEQQKWVCWQWTQSKNIVYWRKQIGRSASSIELRFLHCGSSSLKSPPLNIVPHWQRDSFLLLADDARRDCRVRIIEAQLCAPQVKLSDKKYRIIQQSLPVTPACY